MRQNRGAPARFWLWDAAKPFCTCSIGQIGPIFGPPEFSDSKVAQLRHFSDYPQRSPGRYQHFIPVYFSCCGAISLSDAGRGVTVGSPLELFEVRAGCKGQGVGADEVDLRICFRMQRLTGCWIVEPEPCAVGCRTGFSNGRCMRRKPSGDRGGCNLLGGCGNWIGVAFGSRRPGKASGVSARMHAKTASAHLTPFPMQDQDFIQATTLYPFKTGTGLFRMCKRAPIGVR